MPTREPLVVLHSAGHGDWSTRSLCAVAQGVLRIERTGARWIGDTMHPAGTPPTDPLEALDWADRARVHAQDIDAAPAAGGWVAVLNYELGELLEPAVCTPQRPIDDRHAPLAELLWCPHVQCVDTDVWAGGSPLQPCTEQSSAPDASTHRANIAQVVEYIRAGDVFQTNLARRLSVQVEGDAMAWAQHAIATSQAPFGAMVRLPADQQSSGRNDRVVASMSPELFLHVTRDGVVTSRPIKGTAGADEPVDQLEASDKDRAELHMIVDLVRNDLGRVCQTGSVRVHSARTMETHTTVHHGVADVRGRLKAHVGLVDLLRATFPPGSVTGAPKIRAMQIIRELESRPRGPYCGAIGLLGPAGATMLSVGIRTAVLHGRLDGHHFKGVLDYGTGGGITAQSNPEAEWLETQLKAEALLASFRPSGGAGCPANPGPLEAAAAKPSVGAAGSR